MLFSIVVAVLESEPEVRKVSLEGFALLNLFIAALFTVEYALRLWAMGESPIYRAAHLVIRQHGEDAPIRAAMQADEMLERGDLDGQAVWKRILKAIDELLSVERPEGEKVH